MIRRLRRHTRQTLRLAFFGTHLAVGLSLVLAIFPWVSPENRRSLQRRWAHLLVRGLGVRLQVHGPEKQAAQGLLVCNHISWFDVFVINAAAETTFVCKDEVRDWPLIGLLCDRAGTVFIERGSRRAARRVNEALVARLGEGERIAVFPEGTTGDGNGLLTFRAALLQSAIDAGSHVQPLALRYADETGRTVGEFAYAGETTLWQSICAIAGAQGVTARLALLEAIPAATLPRRELAEQAQAAIHTALGHGLQPKMEND